MLSPELKAILYPPIVPVRSGMLKLDHDHVMYWEECGNPNGKPVLFLHGGPGAGCAPIHRQFFDPNIYRIILFDQRGAGRSRPSAETEHNSLNNLIDDIERLRQHRGIDDWLIFGGSWGSCLALAYGIRHPERVNGLILRGIFTMRRQEIDWLLYGLRRVFPDAWEEFVAPVPMDERHDILGFYAKQLSNPDPEVHLDAAKSWCLYEHRCSYLIPTKVSAFSAETNLQLARLEAHYFLNELMEPDDKILTDCVRLRGHKVHIIHGRYDMVCPPETAYDLAKRIEADRFVLAPNSGHSALEPEIAKELVASTDAFRNLI